MGKIQFGAGEPPFYLTCAHIRGMFPAYHYFSPLHLHSHSRIGKIYTFCFTHQHFTPSAPGHTSPFCYNHTHFSVFWKDTQLKSTHCKMIDDNGLYCTEPYSMKFRTIEDLAIPRLMAVYWLLSSISVTQRNPLKYASNISGKFSSVCMKWTRLWFWLR